MKRLGIVLALASAIAAARPAAAHPGLHERIDAATARIAAAPGDAHLWLERAELFREHGDGDGAMADLDAARRIDPANAAIDLVLSRVLRSRGRMPDAESALDRYLSHRPSDARGFAERASIRSHRGSALAAAADWDEAIARAAAGEPLLPDWAIARVADLRRAGASYDRRALRGLVAVSVRLGRPVSLEIAAAAIEARLGRDANARSRRDRIATGPVAPAMLDSPASAPAAGANPRARLVRGPYLQRATPRSITLRWRTDVPTDSLVKWGRFASALLFEQRDPSPTTEHVVTLDLPDSTAAYAAPDGPPGGRRWFYAIGSSSQLLSGGDAAHSFRLAPRPGRSEPTRIWVLGDSGTANSGAAAVRDAYARFSGGAPADLWLMLGDNAYNSGTDDEYQSAVFDMYPEMLANTVLWPTLGNHDGYSADSNTQTGPYYDIFTLPAHGEAGGLASGTEAYYSFDWGNIHFVCLDSYGTDRGLESPMLTWLEADLAHATAPWTIAFWHHPPYSKGSHDSDYEVELIDMRERALPILERHGVDLVMTGHSHSYERSYLIDGHYGPSWTFGPDNLLDGGSGDPAAGGPYRKLRTGPAPHEGVVYAVAGSSGQTSGGPLDHPAMFVSLDELGSLVLDVDRNRLDVRFIDAAGAVRDRFAIVKGENPPPGPGTIAPPEGGDGDGLDPREPGVLGPRQGANRR